MTTQTFAIVEHGVVREMTDEEIEYYLSLDEQSEVDELR